MAQIKNTFIQGRMEKDLDSRLIPAGFYRDALNVKVRNAASDDVGVVENALSNKMLTSVSVGTNAKCLGMYFDNVEEKIYYFILSDSGSYIVEYDTEQAITSIVLEDTTANILNFAEFNLITGVNLLVDTDNNNRLFMWTDDLNPPRQINIERAKTYGANNFNSAQISLVKPPPLQAPIIGLSNTIGTSGQENNIQERFIRFSHRYKYLDGEYSALSSFSEVAFLPQTFLYDYSVQSNVSMINAFNQVDIALNTGSNLVTAIDIVFKDSNSNTVYIIDSFKKSEQGWADNIEINVEFFNNKIFKALDADQLLRLYDAVPLKAKAQELIGNRLIFGNYVENYNLVDATGNQITINFTTALVTNGITLGVPTRSLKSNRDYEFGIVYLDLQGRMTTVLTADNNTIYIPNANCLTQNQTQITVNNKAPEFAQFYRFFIKQTRTDYDVITPTVFYNDGIYVWVLLQGNEVNKVTEGEFIYVKSDTQAVLPIVVQTRVLEIKTQAKDFLENAATQVAGNYMRVKPSGYELNEEDYEVYEFSSYDSSSNANDNPLRSLSNVIELAVFYGVGLNDMTSGGTYTGTSDIRYIIEIDGTGTPDTFKWSDNNGVSFTTLIPITGASQELDNGVAVTFAATTGHTLTNKWIVSAKSSSTNGIGGDENSKAYAFYKSLPSNENINIDDVIPGGAQIQIDYRETTNETHNFTENYIVGTQFANLEEWFYETPGLAAAFFRTAFNVWFRRGTLTQNGGAKFFTQDPTGDMTLIVRSFGTQNNDLESRVKVYSDLKITSLAQNLIFETIPLNDNSNVFFEIGRTYSIDGNKNHLGFPTTTDQSQTAVLPAILTLDVFNCYAWGNGFESYKIKDLFNATNFKLDTRPSSTIEDYRENRRIASLTYGKVYEQTTNFNGLNEFNLSTANFKDLDDKFESIQKIYSRDTNLIVFQEDKIHRVPYQKNILFDTTGDVNVTQSTNVLGTEQAYAGEFGISENPESFAFYGNAIYFTDVRRSVVCRLDLNGIIEISEYGMKDFFQDSFRVLIRSKKIGAFDLYNKQYVLTVDETLFPVQTATVRCGTNIQFFELAMVQSFILLINASTGTLTFNYNITGTVNIRVTEGVMNTDFNGLTGAGNFVYDQIDTTTQLTITITPVTTTPTISLDVPCPVNLPVPVMAVDDNTVVTQGQFVDVNVLFNDTFPDFNDIVVTVETNPTKGTAVVQANKTIRYTNNGLNDDDDAFEYRITDVTTDTANVAVKVNAGGGPPPGEGEVFDMSTQSFLNPLDPGIGEGACGFNLAQELYHDGINAKPTLADTVYNDLNLTSPYDGFGKYWRIEDGFTIKIETNGLITNLYVCGAGPA